jgi:integrase
MRNEDNEGAVEPLRNRQQIEDIKELLQDQPRNFCLFVVGINSGLRGGDLLSLSWKDVLYKGQIRDKLKVREHKEQKLRSIAITPHMRAALSAWLDVCVKDKGLDPSDVVKTDWLFPSRVNVSKALTVTRLRQLVVEWTRKANIDGHFGSHSLRKTFGLHLRKRGVDLPTIMHALGHSNQSVTLRYLGVDEDTVIEACLKLNL